MATSKSPQNIPNLKYTSRDYNSIYNDLISAIPSLTSVWTNREDSDPGIVLTKLMASLGDMLSYNLDMQALECYGPTVKQRKNAKLIFNTIGYKMHWYESALCDVTITNIQDTDTLSLRLGIFDPQKTMRAVTTSNAGAIAYFILPDSYTQLNTTKVIDLAPGQYVTLPAVQGELKSIVISATSIINNRYYLSESSIDSNHMWLFSGNTSQTVPTDSWTLVDDLSTQTELAKFFEFGVNEFDQPYIELPSYWSTLAVQNDTLTLYYLETLGSSGNTTQNSLQRIDGLATNTYAVTHDTNNMVGLTTNNKPGKDPQTAYEAYIDSKNYANTYDTLVTLYDFEKFTCRQNNMSNVLAIDCQKVRELNEIIYRDNVKYPTTADKEKVYIYLNNDPNTVYSGTFPGQLDSDFTPYNLCLYSIYNNLDLSQASGNWDVTESGLPYREYKISEYVIGNLETAMSGAKIMNVLVDFCSIRVFDWFAQGTLYLYEPVEREVGIEIINNVTEALRHKFTSECVGFGKLINYYDVIDTIQGADNRIRYFNAGDGTTTLIDYPTGFDMSYFNSISTLRYSDTLITEVSEIATHNITIDESCLVTVPVTAITVSPYNSVMTAGQHQQLVCGVLPTNATNKTLTYTVLPVGSTEITVSATGYVTAISATTDPGVYVRVACGDVYRNLNIVVNSPQ